MEYYNSGNIKKKSDVSNDDYVYHSVKKHALETITNALPVLAQSGNQTITYNSYYKTKDITQDIHKLNIEYGPDQQRIRTRYYENNQLKKTKYFVASYEKEVNHATGKTKDIHYISTPYGTVAAYIIENGNAGQMYYLYKDHLGSITHITNQSGTVVERRSFDAWGRPRHPDNWGYSNIPTWSLLDRGYTGHEHLEIFGLINMNGRMYDPIIGRFLSPDPYVQGIGTQGFNRYSYCLNNPLKYTDPTGEFFLLIPFVSYSKNSGWGIGLSIVAGIPNQFSIQMGYGYNFSGKEFYGFIGASAFFNTITLTTTTQSGNSISWSAGLSSIGPIGTNILSVGVDYNMTYDSWNFSVSAWNWNNQTNGWSFNPSVSLMICPERVTNFVREQGFKTNNHVLQNFVANKQQQMALDYFGFEGTYDPNNELFKKYGPYPAITDPKTGDIFYNDQPFEGNFDRFYLTAAHEMRHRRNVLSGKYKGVKITPEIAALEEISTYQYNYRNQGLYLNHGIDLIWRINSSGWPVMIDMEFSKKWWHFIYRIPRKW